MVILEPRFAEVFCFLCVLIEKDKVLGVLDVSLELHLIHSSIVLSGTVLKSFYSQSY